MVSGKSSDQGVGLIDVVNPMHLRRVAVTVVTPLPRALRKGGSQRVEMLVIVAHRDDGVDGQAGRVLADALMQRGLVTAQLQHRSQHRDTVRVYIGTPPGEPVETGSHGVGVGVE